MPCTKNKERARRLLEESIQEISEPVVTEPMIEHNF